MIRFLTAGESHGKALTTIIEGFPSNLKIEKNYIDFHLKRRQMGYGRGGRMKIESDSVEILSGVRFQKTLGSPISLLIKNNDWENWTDKMTSGKRPGNIEKISIPRPGHADLVGSGKYNLMISEILLNARAPEKRLQELLQDQLPVLFCKILESLLEAL